MAHANRFTRMHEHEVGEAHDSSSSGGFISGDNGMMNHNNLSFDVENVGNHHETSVAAAAAAAADSGGGGSSGGIPPQRESLHTEFAHQRASTDFIIQKKATKDRCILLVGVGIGIFVSLIALLIAAFVYEGVVGGGPNNNNNNNNNNKKTSSSQQFSTSGTSVNSHVGCHLEPTNSHVSFLVVGDSGRMGTHNQTEVANAMAMCADNLRPNFIVHTGDIFYPAGLRDDVNKRNSDFAASFTVPYNHDSLQVPWWCVLGNHDYGDGCGDSVKGEFKLDKCPERGEGRSPLNTLSKDLRRRDKRFFVERNYDVRVSADVHIFFMDTNPLIDEYKLEAWGEADVVRGGLRSSGTPTPRLILNKLQSELQQSNARWKIVVAHHPMYSNGKHGEFKELQQLLLDILIDNNVAMWFNGHDHDLQHFAIDRSTKTLVTHDDATNRDRTDTSSTLLHSFTSGAGSKTGRGFPGKLKSVYQMDLPGFMSVKVRDDTASVSLFDYMGAHLHTHDLKRPAER